MLHDVNNSGAGRARGFFAVDRRTWARVCGVGVNGAVSYLVLGRGTVDVDGNVETSEGTKADAIIAVRHIDAHGIVAAAPKSDIGLDTKANVFIAKSGAITGAIVLDTLPEQLSADLISRYLDIKARHLL